MIRTLCLSLIILTMSGITYADKNKFHILLINAYNQGYAWTDNEVRGIQDALSNRDDVVLRIEYMDTKVISDPDYYKMLADIYARKYIDIEFDVVISTDDDALKFVKRYRDRLFPETPLVFAGVNNYTEAKTEGMDNFTGVNEAADFTKNLAFIGSYMPKVDSIVVVNDDLTSGRSLAKEFSASAKQFSKRFTFEMLEPMSMADLKRTLSQLTPNQVVFYLSFFRDGNGVPYASNEAIPQLSKASTVPIFGGVDYMLDQGIVGGLLKSAYFQGKHAGELAQKILDGQKANDLPVIMESPVAYAFDYEQLHRFGLHENNLPAGSSLINEPESFYYLYKIYIWSGIAALSLLLIYIVTLLINIRQRIRAQNGLQSILTASHTLFDITAHQQFKHDMMKSLHDVLPSSKNIFLLRQQAVTDGFKPEGLSIVDTDHNNQIPDSAISLIEKAVDEKTCIYENHQAVAFVDCESSPVNLVYVDGKKKLDRTDKQLLELFSGNLSLSIDNAETYKMSASLQTATRIQNAMLPVNFPVVSKAYGLDLDAFIVPAKEVGGDLYDFFSLDEDHLCLLVGDVSGKGVPAAIFMAMAKTVLRATADISLTPAEILYKANNDLSRDNSESMFVTMFLAIYNKKDGTLTYSDGGHNTPYVITGSGEITALNAKTGIALGVMEDMPFHLGSLTLQPGDAFIIYSDGVTEAMNGDNALYLESRLEACLDTYGQLPAKEFNEALLKDIHAFTGSAQQSDDITSLYFRRN